MGIFQVTDETNKVTEHKTVAEDLQASEIRYRRLFESARDGILILDAASRKITDVNPFMVEFLDYSRDEFLGKELWEIGLFSDKDHSRTAFRELQETGYIRYENMPLQTKAGKLRNVEFTSNVYRENGHHVVQCNIRDITERKRAEEVRYWHSTIVESSNDGIVSFSFDGTVISWNRGAERIFGYAAEEAIGQPVSLLAPLAGQLEQQDEILKKIERGGSVVGFETLCVKKDGGLINVSLTISLIQGDNGRTLGVTAIVLDITERKRTEERLKQSEQWLRTIFETSHEGILVEDDERIHYVNKSYARMFGYDDPEELIGQHISVVIAPEDKERLLEFGTSRLRGEPSPAEYEFKGKRKDGSQFDVEASVAASQIADSNYITTMIRDITERKQADEALRESEARFRAAFEQANVGIVQASFEGRLLIVNPGFCKIIGYPEAEARGMMIRDITHGDDYEKEEDLTRQLMAGETGGYSIEKRYLHKDGHLVWGQMTATLLRRTSGEPYYMLAIVEDISERKLAEEALMKLNEQLEQRVAERTVELMEMNASLQAEIVERRRAESERASLLRRLVMAQEDERRRISRELHDQMGQHLVAIVLLVNSLKDFAHSEPATVSRFAQLEDVAHQLSLQVDTLAWQLRPTELDDLGLHAALENYVGKWSQRYQVPVDFHSVSLADQRLTSEIETAIYRIAQESLNNIIKHARATYVSLILERRGNHVFAIIEDDGCGFDVEGLWGACGGQRRMGLLGMKERTALVGGTLNIESAPGAGTTIFVRIPLALDENGGQSF